MEYSKCLVELDELLNHLPKEDLDKVPEDIRKTIKQEKDKTYIWKYDQTKELKDQKLDRKTIAMICYLNMEYLVNEEQKKLLREMHQFNEIKSERAKKEKYKYEDLFKRSSNNSIENEQSEENHALVDVKEIKWYSKLFSFIKKIIKKAN